MDANIMKLALVIALCGALPAGAALAREHRAAQRREHPHAAAMAQLAGIVEAVRRDRITLRAEDGRLLRVDADRCAAAAAPGERVMLLGRWEEDGEFEAKRLTRADGTVLLCGDDHPRHRNGETGAPAPARD